MTRPATRPDVFELRVHGVSGTSPESLLARHIVRRDAGDRIAGFYRPEQPEDRYDVSPWSEGPVYADAPRLEGYNWGGLTSGSPGRALWLLLLPFTLVNVAARARPVVPSEPSSPRWARRLTHFVAVRSGWVVWYACRLLAVCLTLLLVLTTAGISIDLVWWQCRSAAAPCSGLPEGLMTRLESRDPGSTLVLAALVPVVVLAVLWLTSRSTIGRYEATHEKNAAYDEEDPAETDPPLSSPWMWRNDEPVRRLRSLHLQAGTAVVLWVVTAASGDDLGPSWSSASWLAGVALPAAVLVYTAGMLAHPRLSDRRRWRWRDPAKWTVWTLLALAAATQIYRILGGDGSVGRPPSGGVRSYDDSIIGLLVVTVLTATALTVAVACAAIEQGRSLIPTAAPATSHLPSEPDEVRGEHEPLRPGVWGLATALLAVLGVLFAAGLSAAMYSYAATWLHSGLHRPGPGAVNDALAAFTMPDAFAAATTGIHNSFLVVAVVALLCGAVVLWKIGCAPFLPVRVRPANAFGRDYAAHGAVTGRDRRRKQIERAMYVGTLVDTVPVVVAWLVAAATVIFLTLGIAVLAGATEFPAPFTGGGVAAQGLGAFMASWSLIGVVALAALAFRVDATRRTVGILWDIASFWPRTVHPFSAPCYAERAVPDLVTRILFHVDEDRRVVLAGHSQGSVLSAAALFRIAARRPRAMHRIALLTFGCVLRRLYGRMFPRYFGPADLAALESSLLDAQGRPRWRNLWRYTDYLGGQVTAGPPQRVPQAASATVAPKDVLVRAPLEGPSWEWHSPDPPVFDPLPGDTVHAGASRHSEFWSDRSGIYQLAVVDLVKELDACSSCSDREVTSG